MFSFQVYAFYIWVIINDIFLHGIWEKEKKAFRRLISSQSPLENGEAGG